MGYSLDVDGGFGEKTRAAVLDYQRKNGLRVDGVAGSETMGSLLARLTPATSGPSTSGQVLSGVSDETMSRMRQLEKGYTPSDEVTAALPDWELLVAEAAPVTGLGWPMNTTSPRWYRLRFTGPRSECYGA